jgi:hypothetical protein
LFGRTCGDLPSDGGADGASGNDRLKIEDCWLEIENCPEAPMLQSPLSTAQRGLAAGRAA